MEGIYLPEEGSNRYLTYLSNQIREALEPLESVRDSYWKCFCCLCPTWGVSSLQTKNEVKSKIIEIFNKSFASQIVNQSRMGLCISDSHGFVVECNESYLQFCDRTRELVIGYPNNFLSDELSLEGEESHHSEVELPGDETPRWVFVTTSFLRDEDQHITYYLTQLEDISSFKKLQQRARRQMDDASPFSHHEIRTSLFGIMGMSQALINGQIPQEAQRQSLQAILHTSDHMLEVLNHQLDLAKLQQSEMRFHPKPFTLSKFLHEIVTINAQRLTPQVTLSLQLDPEIPSMIEGDSMRLRQVIENILGNAIKYTKMGTIELNANLEETRDFEIVLRFAIIDSGNGIPEEDLENIWKPYGQARNAEGGTGLGLYLAKFLVEAMNGTMLPVRSKLGAGSSFGFSIPFPKYVKRAPVRDIKEVKERLSGKKVLVVDDVYLNLRVLSKTLLDANMTVETALSGANALDILRNDPHFDFVLLDYEMPEQNGLETARQMRAEQFTMPIITLTAHDSSEQLQQSCQDAGIDAILQKPARDLSLFPLLDRFITRAKEHNPLQILTPPPPYSSGADMSEIDSGPSVTV